MKMSIALEDMKFEYYKRVREIINKRVKEISDYGYDINYSKLRTYLYENYGIIESEKTIAKLFKENEISSIQPHLLVALCNTLGIDIYEALQYPRDIEINYKKHITLKDIFHNNKRNQENKAFYEQFIPDDISFLSNELYEGVFNCYYFAPIVINNSISNGKKQPQSNYIRHAKLEIKRTNGETVARFTECETRSGNAFTFVGRVIRLEKVNKIYIFLSEQNGNGFLWLLFNNVHLKKRKLYYKEIAMLTHTLTSESKPIFEKMILTKNELDIKNKENETIIRGILTFDTENILVPENKIDKIIAMYPKLKFIFDTKECFYKISQYDIINSNRIDMSYNERAEALLNIMSLSNNHTQSVISQEQYMHNYFYDFQDLED